MTSLDRFIKDNISNIFENYKYELVENELYIYVTDNFYYLIEITEDKEELVTQISFFLSEFDKAKKILSNKDKEDILINSLSDRDLYDSSNRLKLEFLSKLPDKYAREIADVINYLISHEIYILKFHDFKIIFNQILLNNSAIQITFNINCIDDDIIFNRILLDAVKSIKTIRALKGINSND